MEFRRVGNLPPYFHHGFFVTLKEAILAHAGEALAERQAYEHLPPTSQNDVIQFLTSLQVALEHPFAQPSLLIEALTHPSAGAASATPVADFERLEFLGDRVLGLLVARQLMERFPKEIGRAHV